MLQLQMTGYMLRNAEYVMALRKVLQLSTRSAAEYRATFERLDTDGSGYIETSEVEKRLVLEHAPHAGTHVHPHVYGMCMACTGGEAAHGDLQGRGARARGLHLSLALRHRRRRPHQVRVQ